MKYGIIIGSHRKESQSTKVGKFIENLLHTSQSQAEVQIFDLRLNPLPLWDESMWGADEGTAKAVWQSYSDGLSDCDAFIIIAPEWSGMVPAGLKNFFLYCTHELEHKPALIVGVSSTRGGAYPVAELRMSSYKNTYICYIPNHVIIRKVEEVLNTAEVDGENKSDVYIRQRLEHSLQVLEQYAIGLELVRKSGVEDREQFAHGM